MLISILIIILAVVSDQITKYFAYGNLRPVGEKIVIENIFRFRYVENRGAAFGMLSEHRWVFMVLSVVLIIAVGIWLYINRKNTPYYFTIPAAMIVGGGIGNMIDRIFRGFVVDFIDVYCIDFYVFNVADSFVTVGCVLLFIAVILDDVLSKKKTQKTENENNAETVTETAENNSETNNGDNV